MCNKYSVTRIFILFWLLFINVSYLELSNISNIQACSKINDSEYYTSSTNIHILLDVTSMAEYVASEVSCILCNPKPNDPATCPHPQTRPPCLALDQF